MRSSQAAVRLAAVLGLFAPQCVLANDGSTVWATPHDSYSSSVGVLGCKINTNRVAYWPQAIDCDNLCVTLSYEDRTLHLLRIDQSQGAYDVSYDAWNYLYTGNSATEYPAAGGAIEMRYENVDASECADLLRTDGNALPLSAANSMNFLASCLDREGGSWVADNYVLYNIGDAICTLGHDEQCELDWPAANQATCPHMLGDMPRLEDAPVYNIRYPSGDTVVAGGTGEVVADVDLDDEAVKNGGMRPTWWSLALGVCAVAVGLGL